MEAARRVLLVEGGMGLLWAGYGFGTAPSAAWEWWPVAFFAATVAAIAAAAGDYGYFGFRSVRAGALLVGWFLAVVASAAAFVAVTDATVETVVRVGLGGLGAGLLAYRFVYGVVRPVPEPRLEAARERAV